MKTLKTFSLVVLFFLCALPVFAEDEYPQLQIDGYKKYEYRKVEVTPTKNYFNAITQLGNFVPTYTGGPWQESLMLKITGKLSERLSVAYDLEQQPDSPDKFDVKVKYDNHELIFGDINANFSNNEFASTSKFANGVMLSSYDTWYDVLLVPSAKVKSQSQSIVSQYGNNLVGPYSLGHGGIVEGSENIQLNGKPLTRGKDYTIDYIEGKVTFSKIITDKDEFKYSYEYTNIVDLFFPTLSRRDFFGAQGRVKIDPNKFGRKIQPRKSITKDSDYSFPASYTLPLSTSEASSEAQDRVRFEKVEADLGRYSLPFYPVMPFSETITLGSKTLKKDQDYLIDYAGGKITLMTKDRPSVQSPIQVKYSYYVVSKESISFKGSGGRGPYDLKNTAVVPGTERIYINQIMAVKDLDYVIDYDKGKILFTLDIGPATQIEVKYFSQQYEPLPPEPTLDQINTFSVGGTYLREAAKAGTSSPSAAYSESKNGSELITQGNIFQLSKFPVVTSDEATFTLQKNGVDLVYGVDYVFPSTEVDPVTGYAKVTPPTKLAYLNDLNDLSDGYTTGTIRFLITPESSAVYNASYSYRKPVVAKISGSGTGSRGPYYLRGFRNLVPGLETVQVWDQGSSIITIYTRNSSFEADAGSTGYSINYYKDNPYITFNDPLMTTKNYTVIFQYIPQATTTGSQLSQDVIGFNANAKLGDKVEVDAQVAHSTANKMFSTQSTTEVHYGNSGKTYMLSSESDIVENSERVSINGRVLNKDSDYFVNYTRPGQIVFFYLSPTSIDAISVDYQFKTSGSGTTVNVEGDAYKIAAQAKLVDGKVGVSGAVREIDPDFQPLGSTPIGSGSRQNNYDVSYNPREDIGASWSYRENQDQIGTYKGSFLRGYDNILNFRVAPKNLVDIRLNHRSYRTIDDLLPGETLHNNDLERQEWGMIVNPSDYRQGLFKLTNSNEFRRAYSNTDSTDKINQAMEKADYFRTNFGLSWTERAKAGISYQYNEPLLTRVTTTDSSVESHSLSKDTSYDLSLDLTPQRIYKLTTRMNLIQHEEINLLGTGPNSASRNEGYHIDFIPVPVLSTSYDQSRIEQLSVLSGGKNPKSERSTTNATYTPLRQLTLSWDGAWDDNYLEIGTKSGGKSNQYVADTTPFIWSTGNMKARFTLYDRNGYAPNGSNEVNTDTNSFKQEYSVSVTPHSMVTVTPSFIQEDYLNKDNNPVGPVSTETQNQTTHCQIIITPDPVISLTTNYDLKVTKDKRTEAAKNHSFLELAANYRPFSWGNVNLGWKNEENMGEVQAGVLMDLDYVKVTTDLAVNMTIPQDNTVLSSIVLSATYRNVNFKNRKNSGDDFIASLLTFEGTLNF